MSRSDPDTRFVLSYEMSIDDLKEAYAIMPTLRRGRRRGRVFLVVMVIVVLLAAFGLGVMPNLLDVGVSAILFGGLYGMTGIAALWLWAISPKQIARRVLRLAPYEGGRRRDEVGADGVTTVASDGTTTFIPWSAVHRVHEGMHAFHLLGAKDMLRTSLPKRGLDHPDLVPALREFLDDSIRGRGQRPAPDPSATG